MEPDNDLPGTPAKEILARLRSQAGKKPKQPRERQPPAELVQEPTLKSLSPVSRRKIFSGRAADVQKIKQATRRAEVMEYFRAGYFSPSVIARQSGIGSQTVRKYLKQAIAHFAETSREQVHEYLSREWEKLDVIEDQLFQMFRELREGDGGGLQPEAPDSTVPPKQKKKADPAFVRITDGLDKIVGRRLEILRMVDPGVDESVDSDLVMVLVSSRAELSEVMEAVAFKNALTVDGKISGTVPPGEDENQAPPAG